ncbi:hypothetical protein HanPSC8_Chr17g0758631 [Helianthus annuus]|nr:hypothetical protein HanPSC8_Chr17g0758631 [Helianthus annuus]
MTSYLFNKLNVFGIVYHSILGDIWKGKVTSSEVSYNSFPKVRSSKSIAGLPISPQFLGLFSGFHIWVASSPFTLVPSFPFG